MFAPYTSVLSVVKLDWARGVVTGVALSRTTSRVRAMIPGHTCYQSRPLHQVFVTTYVTHFDVGGLGFVTAVFIGHRP